MGKQVVLHDSPIFLLLMVDDREIIILQQLGAMVGLSRSLIEGAFPFHDICWHEESDSSIGSTSLLRLLGVTVLVHDVIIEETCRFCTRMSNQRLFLRHFQFEGLVQEMSQLLFNFLRFRSRTSKAKKRIIRISNIVESSIGFIVGIN